VRPYVQRSSATHEGKPLWTLTDFTPGDFRLDGSPTWYWSTRVISKRNRTQAVSCRGAAHLQAVEEIVRARDVAQPTKSPTSVVSCLPAQVCWLDVPYIAQANSLPAGRPPTCGSPVTQAAPPGCQKSSPPSDPCTAITITMGETPVPTQIQQTKRSQDHRTSLCQTEYIQRHNPARIRQLRPPNRTQPAEHNLIYTFDVYQTMWESLLTTRHPPQLHGRPALGLQQLNGPRPRPRTQPPAPQPTHPASVAISSL
jgi:hypothetical protein